MKANDCTPQADCTEVKVEGIAEQVSAEKRKVKLTHTGVKWSSQGENRNQVEPNVIVQCVESRVKLMESVKEKQLKNNYGKGIENGFKIKMKKPYTPLN